MTTSPFEERPAAAPAEDPGADPGGHAAGDGPDIAAPGDDRHDPLEDLMPERTAFRSPETD